VQLDTECIVKPYDLLKLTCRKIPREENMAEQSHSRYVAQYLGFCDGERTLSVPASRDRAVTKTFLHETAVSVPTLWRLSDRLPADGLSLGLCERPSGTPIWSDPPNSYQRHSRSVLRSIDDGSLQNTARTRG
jgi:hypothetical protein